MFGNGYAGQTDRQTDRQTSKIVFFGLQSYIDIMVNSITMPFNRYGDAFCVLIPQFSQCILFFDG